MTSRRHSVIPSTAKDLSVIPSAARDLHLRWMRCGSDLLVALLVAVPLHAQAIRIATAGPRGSGVELLRGVLATNPEIIRSDTGVVTLPRGARHERSVVIFAEGVRLAGTVNGDVVVVGGDLFVHPGAQIDGRAVAIGGGVYPSTLAVIRGERRAFRDGTFVWSDAPGGVMTLDYRPLIEAYMPVLFSLPSVYGARLPTYDRVDGLSARWGPFLQPSHAIGIDPTVTYRSHRGAFDPALRVQVEWGNGYRAQLDGSRDTRHNEGWIRGNFSNSLSSLIGGGDARNYYRARVLAGRISRDVELAGGTTEFFVGAMHERAAAAVSPLTPVTPGALVPLRRRAWSLTGRDDTVEGMRRPNPFVPDGRISSALAGVTGRMESATGIKSDWDVRLESPWEVQSGRRFQQITLDGTMGFRTFGAQRFQISGHYLTTLSDTAPPQRWSYLGGSGTLPTFDLLSMGGDELLFIESRYIVPITLVKLPFLGSPTFALRHMVGAAGLGRLPALEQNLAARVQVGFLRAEYVVNPRNRDRDLDIGLTLSR